MVKNYNNIDYVCYVLPSDYKYDRRGLKGERFVRSKNISLLRKDAQRMNDKLHDKSTIYIIKTQFLIHRIGWKLFEF